MDNTIYNIRILISVLWISLLNLSFSITHAEQITDNTASPYFTVEPQDLILKSLSDSGTLSCEVGPVGVQVRWTLNGNPIRNSNSGNLTVGGLKEPRRPGSDRESRGRLGSYRCVAFNRVGSVVSRPAVVSLAEIKILTSSQEITTVDVVEGNPVFIPCDRFISHPSASLTFERSTGPVLPETNRVTYVQALKGLLISSTQLSDTDYYYCSASNPLKKQRLSDSSLTRINVIPALDSFVPKFTYTSPENVYVTEGDTLTLICLAEGHPVPVITWKRYGGILPHDRHENQNGLLEIRHVQKLDEGTYICETSQTSRDGIRHIVFVNVRELPVIVLPPEDTVATYLGSAKLTCKVHGSPTPNVTWLHNSLPIANTVGFKPYSIQGTNLVINQVTPQLSGMYQCMATNSIGVALAAARLTVLSQQNDPSRIEEKMLNAAPIDGTTNSSDNYRLRLLQGAEKLNSVVDQAADKNQNRKQNGASKPGRQSSSADLVTQNKENRRRQNNKRLSEPRRPAGTSALNSKSDAAVSTEDSSLKKDKDEFKRQAKGRAALPPRLSVILVSDDSVLVEWKKVRKLNGMRVLFVKIQYKNLGDKRSKGWITVDEDFSPKTESYTITGLKPGQIYEFRLVHVYTNHDNKHGPKTRLRMSVSGRRTKVAPPPPVIVKVQALSNSSIGIYWQYLQTDRVDIEGFLVYYKRYQNGKDMLSSITADMEYGVTENKDNPDDLQIIVSNEDVRDLVLYGLSADTEYSICMQCFTGKQRSLFSNTVVQRTLSASSKETFSRGYQFENIPRHFHDTTIKDLRTTSPLPDNSELDKFRGAATIQTDETLYMILGIILGALVVMLIMGGLGCYCSQRYQSTHIDNRHYSKKFETGYSCSSNLNMLTTQQRNQNEDFRWFPAHGVGSGLNRFLDQMNNADDVPAYANINTARSSFSSSQNSAQRFVAGSDHQSALGNYPHQIYQYTDDTDQYAQSPVTERTSDRSYIRNYTTTDCGESLSSHSSNSTDSQGSDSNAAGLKDNAMNCSGTSLDERLRLNESFTGSEYTDDSSNNRHSVIDSTVSDQVEIVDDSSRRKSKEKSQKNSLGEDFLSSPGNYQCSTL